jgi:predicted phosphodiesterase
VAAVAFGGTHRATEQEHEGVLFFNPGSPNLPVEGSPAAVAVLDLAAAGAPRVQIVTIEP